MQPIERVSQTDMIVKELTKFFLSDAINEGDKAPNRDGALRTAARRQINAA